MAQLLIRLWKAEEKRMNCFRGERGELIDLEYPMAGAEQRAGELM